jgi:DNA-binding NtrC family response regulator
MYARLLERAGHTVSRAATAAEAVARQATGAHRVVMLDLGLPDGDGLDVLRAMRAADPTVKAIVVTADGSINRAVAAMRSGAFDFLVKPFDESRLLTTIDAALHSAADEQAHRPPEPGPEGFQGLIGVSTPMRRVYETIREVARSSATVFVTGESGTGKELCAQAVHALSPRRARPFVPLNCGAIPRDLLESEVFGHLRGSFTGAIADKTGAAAAADGGTLFLDEVCEMDIDLQTKLLRFLQTSTIQPVGSPTPRKVDVRIVCATNRDPLAEVEAGRFRADLFYRLHVVPIHLPPLREREGDVALVAERLLEGYAREEGRRFRGLDDEARAAFLAYGWPGNVRELQNVLRNIAVLRDGEAVTLAMLPPKIAAAARGGAAAGAGPRAATPVAPPGPVSLRESLAGLVGTPLATLEREFIEATIARCEGSIPRAARLLDVNPSTLYRKRETWAKG